MDDLALLRLWTDEPENGAWTDAQLLDLVELHGSARLAAAAVWEAKAAALAANFDFAADGGSFQRRQQYENALEQARWHRAYRDAVGRRIVSHRATGDGGEP